MCVFVLVCVLCCVVVYVFYFGTRCLVWLFVCFLCVMLYGFLCFFYFGCEGRGDKETCGVWSYWIARHPLFLLVVGPPRN